MSADSDVQGVQRSVRVAWRSWVIDPVTVAAPALCGGLDRPEGFISPFQGDREVCDDLIVGTWFSWVHLTRTELTEIDFRHEFVLDGVALDLTTTSISRVRTANPTPVWGFTVGAPVIGVLDAGVHILEVTAFLDGVPIDFLPIEITSVSC